MLFSQHDSLPFTARDISGEYHFVFNNVGKVCEEILI